MTEFDSWLLRQLWEFEDQQELEELATDSELNPSNPSDNDSRNL